MTYELWQLEDDHWGRGERPRMNHAGGGLESHYDPRIAREILMRVFKGQTVRQIARDIEMPAYCTIYHWAKNQPDFRWRWQGARAQLAWERLKTMAYRQECRVRWREERVARGGRRGRGSSYTRAKAEAFCGWVMAGATLTQITARADMPSMKVLYTWLRQEAEFRAMYAAAREWRLNELRAQADQVADMALDRDIGRLGFRMVKRRVAKIEGRIGRMTAKTYRDRAVKAHPPVTWTVAPRWETRQD